MFSFDRDTTLIASVAVCIVATIFLYREFRKSKNDLYELKNLVDKHDSFMYSRESEEYMEEIEEQAPPPTNTQEVPITHSSQPPVVQPTAQ